MEGSWAALAAMLGVAIAVLPTTAVQAAELQVLAGGGMTAPLKEIGAQFEAASGHKVVLRFGTVPELVKLAAGGGPFDLAIAPPELFQDAAVQARFARGGAADVARVGLGVAVRSGAPKPEIGTPDGFKRALLAANSVATVPESAVGAQVLRLFARLGIADAMQAKLKPAKSPAQLVEIIAGGEAELGVFLTNVLTAPGLDLTGPIPAELQQETVYRAVLASESAQTAAAEAFVAYLKSPAAIAVIKAKGMTPG